MHLNRISRGFELSAVLAFCLFAVACGGGASMGGGTGPPPPGPTEILYVEMEEQGGFVGFPINISTGILGSPLPPGVGTTYNTGMVANPITSAFYVADWTNSPGRNLIDEFSPIDSQGTLAQVDAVEPLTNAGQGYGLSIDPKGKFLYSVEGSDGIFDGVNSTIQVYTLSQTGTPAPASYVQSSAYLSRSTIDPAGRFLYVGFQGSNFGVSVYSIDSATGGLTEVTGSPFDTLGCFVSAIFAEPAGSFLYVQLTPGNTCTSPYPIIGFSLNGTTGALVPFAGSPFAGSNTINGNLAFDRSGKFAFLATIYSPDVGNTLSVFAIDPASGILSSTGGPAIASQYGDIPIIDPSGQFLYIVDNPLLEFRINPTTGALTNIGAFQFSKGSPGLAVMMKTH